MKLLLKTSSSKPSTKSYSFTFPFTLFTFFTFFKLPPQPPLLCFAAHLLAPASVSTSANYALFQPLSVKFEPCPNTAPKKPLPYPAKQPVVLQHTPPSPYGVPSDSRPRRGRICGNLRLPPASRVPHTLSAEEPNFTETGPVPLWAGIKAGESPAFAGKGGPLFNVALSFYLLGCALLRTASQEAPRSRATDVWRRHSPYKSCSEHLRQHAHGFSTRGANMAKFASLSVYTKPLSLLVFGNGSNDEGLGCGPLFAAQHKN